MTTRRSTLQGLAAGAAALAAPSVFAAEDRSPITLLVGAASTMDFTARMVGEHLHDTLGRTVIVVSKLGAGGRLALGDLKRAAPDGRTLMLSTSSPFAIYPNIYTRLDYDPVADFTPIAGVCWFDVSLATGPATGAADMKQLIAWARSKGSDVVYGAAPGNGSSSHFAGIATALATGLKMNIVPYKDSAAGIGDVITGRLPIMITGTGAMSEMHRAGRLRIVGTSGSTRSPLLPDVPTLIESGVDANIVNSAGLYGPANLPREMVEKLHAALAPMFRKPEAMEKLSSQGMAPDFTTAAQLAETLARERKRFKALADASGYVPQAS